METWGVRSIRNALAAWKPALAVVGIAASLACAGGAQDRRSGQADDARAAQLEAVLIRARDAQTAERYDEAAAAYAEATALDRHVAELWANRGLMEYFARRYAESDKSLLEAILTKPALVSPYLFAGLDELELGRLDVAVQHLEHARALNPRDAQTQAALVGPMTASIRRGRPPRPMRLRPSLTLETRVSGTTSARHRSRSLSRTGGPWRGTRRTESGRARFTPTSYCSRVERGRRTRPTAGSPGLHLRQIGRP